MSKESSEPTIYYFTDTEKAFDWVEWEFIMLLTAKWGLGSFFAMDKFTVLDSKCG